MELWLGTDIEDKEDFIFGIFKDKPILLRIIPDKAHDNLSTPASSFLTPRQLSFESYLPLLNTNTLPANDLLSLLEACVSLYFELGGKAYPGLRIVRSLISRKFPISTYYIGMHDEIAEDYVIMDAATWKLYDIIIHPQKPLAVPKNVMTPAISTEAIAAARAARDYFKKLAGSYRNFYTYGLED